MTQVTREVTLDVTEEQMKQIKAILATPKKEHRHRSATHEELFFHVKVEDDEHFSGGTVFARLESEPSPLWYTAVAICSNADQFNRARGRTIARRRYFEDRNDNNLEFPKAIVAAAKPTYAYAQIIVREMINILKARKGSGDKAAGVSHVPM